MLRLLLLGVLFITGCTSIAPQRAQPDYAKESMSVGKLTGETLKFTDTGTAMVINDKCVLTAEHVTHGYTDMKLEVNGGTYLMTVGAKDEKVDLAILCSDTVLAAPAIQIGPQPALYDPLHVIGFPLEARYFLTEGRYEGDVYHSAPVAPGNSGGPIFNSSGQVVGMVDAIAVYPMKVGIALFPHLGVMVTRAQILEFLTTNHIQVKS